MLRAPLSRPQCLTTARTVAAFSRLAPSRNNRNEVNKLVLRTDLHEAEAATLLPMFSERSWNGERTLIAARQISAGDHVYTVPRAAKFLLAQPDMHSVQVAHDEHLDFATALPAASLTHHECDPNGNLLIGEMGATFVARRTIAKDEILSFDYNTTEWLMDSPFDCRCGKDNCVGRVGGFSLLEAERQAELLPRTSGWIRSLVVDEWRSVLATQKQPQQQQFAKN